MNYFSIEEWEGYIITKIVPIRDYAIALLKFWEFLRSLEGKYISEVSKDYPELEVIFLGGTNENGYKENSFAKAIKEIFGASIDVVAYHSHILQGLEPKVPLNKVEKTEIINFIKEIKSLTEEIVNISGFNSDRVIPEDEFIKNPDKVLDGFTKFLELCLNICVGYDPYTTFIWNIRKITRKYLEERFPEVKDEKNLEFLKNFLGLREIFVPNIDDEKIKRDYTILGFPDYASCYYITDTANSHLIVVIGDYISWCYKLYSDYYLSKYYLNYLLGCYEGLSSNVHTLGGRILNLNEIIWELFQYKQKLFHPLSLILEDIPNPKEDYIQACKVELEKIGWKILRDSKIIVDPAPTGISSIDAININMLTHVRVSEYIVEGGLITKKCNSKRKQDRKTGKYYRREYHEILNKPFLIFLDKIMPAIFLGVYELVFSKDKRSFVVIIR